MLRSVRDVIATGLLGLAHRVASDSGWSRLIGDMGVTDMHSGLQRLRRRGVTLNTVVDVGACVGDWTRLLRSVYSHAEVLMVEPQRRHRQSLIDFCAANGPGLRTEHTLLGPPGQTSAVFHVTEDASGGTGSSVLPENSDVPRRAETMPMTTLDDLLQRTGIPAPDLLKLDVQGFEIEVLKGAQATLAASPLVLLEVSFWPYNIGAPLLHDVLQWMQRSGYRAYDVLDLSRRPDETLVQADILFASANSPLLTEQTTRFFSRA